MIIKFSNNFRLLFLDSSSTIPVVKGIAEEESRKRNKIAFDKYFCTSFLQIKIFYKLDKKLVINQNPKLLRAFQTRPLAALISVYISNT
ncbi:hypothetical protein BpHYR1_051055 [Brachionus plicatilis]|uniref:Uncharacterized protein n=1 Tax=Brachionus plicatilis TaxID=10195 RepID=A0A3M7PRY8_BRAPC|nr:hypothetical protein BpHYR1_051055 [Brachionus plicatilis]